LVVGGPCEVEGELWNEEKGVGGGKSDPMTIEPKVGGYSVPFAG
jgi:hypothetical protein